MATLTAKVGASNLSSEGTIATTQSKSPSKPGSKFDIIVYPNAPCKLVIQAHKRFVDAGKPVNEWIERIVASKPITKITTLHVALPSITTSYSIVFHTNNAKNTSHHTFSSTFRFSSFGVEVNESTYQGTTTNNITCFKLESVKLPAKLEEQDITIPEDDVYSAPAKDVSDEKGKK